tara:strand:- start:3097 stop:3951 length:855 start_codon:yes stop_codon:yes gene_type:complete
MAYGSSSNKSSGAKTVASRLSKAPTKPLPLKQAFESRTGFIPPSTNIRAPQTNAEQVILNRDVFNKTAFNNTIDTSFSQLDQAPPDLSFFDPNLATVNDFFNIYQNLFYQIPKFGPINSHEYLVVESTAYSNVIENQEQIDALLEEITDLREENLQLQLDINELLGVRTTLDQAIQQSNDDATNLDEILQQEANLGAEQSNSSSDLITTTPNTIGGIGGLGGAGSGAGIGIGAIQMPNFIIQSGAGAAEGLNPTLSLSLQEQQGGIPTVGMNNVIPINVGSPIY